MSRTELFILGGPEPGELGSTSNSWRGGMYVWNEIAKKYFGLEGFPMFDQSKQNAIWNASFPEMTLAEHIVLMTTMDRATVKTSDCEAIAVAFEEYFNMYPSSSLYEQAQLLRSVVVHPEAIIAWNQTSVSEFWGMRFEYDEGTDDEDENAEGDYVFYDPSTQDKHFDAYAAALTKYRKWHEPKSEPEPTQYMGILRTLI
jgi:hypothetical protein